MPRLTGLTNNKNMMTIAVDLEPAIYMIGAGQAFARSLNDKVYIDALFDEAFESADADFDRQMDAIAKTGAVSHMYEWGTIGVNRGRSNARMAPENPKAKLWSNYSYGNGLERIIGWIYRPSVAMVPKPTAGETGMSQDVIAALRPQYFTWKAEVMEEGRRVTISPREAKFLLIPATEENRRRFTGWRSNDLKRGYMLTNKTISASPGANKYAGEFTKYWDRFWLNVTPYFEQEISRMVREDYFPVISKVRPPTKMMPARMWKPTAQIQETANATQKRVTAKRRMKANAAKKKRAARKTPR